MKNPITHVCSCGIITTYPTMWSLKRKKYPDLCKKCANANRANTPQQWSKEGIDWTVVYDDPALTADNLTEAKRDGKKYYKHQCDTHGLMPYATLDNTCRKCTKEAAKRRNVADPSFNRPRVILGSVKRRANQRGIPFDLTMDMIRGNIPDKCPIFGVPLSYDADRDTSPSIDRLDPKLGYVEDNIRIISNRANRVKNDGTADEHLKVAAWMMQEAGMSSEQIIQTFMKVAK